MSNMFRRRKPKLDSLDCDTTGWNVAQESPVQRMWATPDGSYANFQFNNVAPTFPFDLTDLSAAEAFYDNQSKELGGAMISVEIDRIRDLQYLRGVFKYRSPEPGSLALYFVGILVFPFQRFSYQINTEALEVGTTGAREAAVMASGDGPPQSDEPPQVVESMDEFFDQVRQADLKRIPADDPKYDELIPTHPLSLVRRLQEHVISTLTYPDWLPKLPSYRVGA